MSDILEVIHNVQNDVNRLDYQLVKDAVSLAVLSRDNLSTVQLEQTLFVRKYTHAGYEPRDMDDGAGNWVTDNDLVFGLVKRDDRAFGVGVHTSVSRA